MNICRSFCPSWLTSSPSINDDQESLYAVIDENSSSIPSRLIGTATTLITAVGAGIGMAYTTNGTVSSTLTERTIRTLSSFGMGASLTTLLTAIGCPRSVMTRIRLESWRLGIPLYYLLTEIYLNTIDPEVKQWIGNVFMILFGIQVASAVNSYVTKTFKDKAEREGLSLMSNHDSCGSYSEPQQKLLCNSKGFRWIKTPCKLLVGGGMLGSSYLMTDQVVQKVLVDFGTLILTAAITQPLFDQVEKKYKDVEEHFRLYKSVDEQPPLSLKISRIAFESLGLFSSIGIAALFFDPNWKTLAGAGVLQGIKSSHLRQTFVDSLTKRPPPKKALSTQRRLFERLWMGTRVLGTSAGLATLQVLTLSNHTKVDTIAISSFVGGIAIGYASTLATDKAFKVAQSSPLMREIAYRLLHNPAFAGVDPLYLYYYATQKINVGSSHLTHLSFGTEILDFTIWSALGLRTGRDLAQYESLPPEKKPRVQNISEVLAFQNIFTLIEETLGSVQ
ncbi:MAG: hypothetical protein S4CHLAM123_11300 [Chlamydiales bacterium]|nr:hypothetical protein [Chlamydiales bacterium]